MDTPVALTEATAEPGHNSNNRLIAFLDNVVDDLGKQSARGTTALSDLAMRVVETAHDGALQPQAAKVIYERYASAAKNAGGTQGSVKTNTSKIVKLIELGCLPDGLRIAEDAIRIRDGVEKPKSVFEALVDVARLRLKEKRKLTDDEIIAALIKAPAQPKAKVNPVTNDWQAVAKTVAKLSAEHGYGSVVVKDDPAIGKGVKIMGDEPVSFACHSFENLEGRFIQLPRDRKKNTISELVTAARVLTELLSKLMAVPDDDPRPVYIPVTEYNEEITAEQSA